jgi:hypothetical protein
LTVSVRDNGYRKVVANVASLRAPVGVKVGILDDKPHSDGATVADIALVHEYGLGDVPERSFLRAWVDENKTEIQARLKKETEGVIFGQHTADEAMNRFGLWAVGEIKKRIVAGISPPLDPATIKAKGSSTPLVDTGQLISSITHAITRAVSNG